MKKTLLLSFMALATMGSAQILVTESFENATYPGFVVTGGYTGTAGTYISGACDGTVAIGAEAYGFNDANRTVNLVYTKPAGLTANGKKIDISFTYSTSAYDAASSIGGTMNVGYSTDGGTTYTPVGSAVTLTAAPQPVLHLQGQFLKAPI